MNPTTLAAVLLISTTVSAQTVEERLQRLERENAEFREALGREVERLQFRDFVPVLADGRFGMGPAASKVYNQDEGLSVGGYGEFLYRQRSGDTDVFDALRGVVYLGYRFDDRWIYNGEIEFEHGSTSTSSGTTNSGGSVSLEFSYLEYMHRESFNVRAGVLLVPMGFINELHEPTTFMSAARPETEQRIIPSTWRETGIGVHGSLNAFDYKLYAITSLNGENFDRTGLRGGRQKGNRAAADDMAIVGRLDISPCQSTTIGGSFFVGDTGQDGVDRNKLSIPAMRTMVFDAHATFDSGGLLIRGLYTTAQLENTGTFNRNTGANLARQMAGYYVEVGYDVMRVLAPESRQHALRPFFRWERLDTQQRMARGFVRDPTQKETILTYGIHYRPIDQVVIKVDFQQFDVGDDRLQVLFGYVF